MVSSIAQYNGDNAEIETQIRIISAILDMFNAYLDWLPSAVIFQENAIFLKLLCTLLTDNRLRINVIDCLLTLVNRKVITYSVINMHCVTKYSYNTLF